MIRMRVYRFSEDLFEKSLRRMDYQSFYFGRDYNFHDTRDEFQAGSDTLLFLSSQKRNLMVGKYRPQAETIFIKTREEE